MKNKIHIDVPDKIKYVLEKLNSNGFEAYAVGGCVRDSIMGNIPNDWDVCTSAKPEKTSEVFSTHRIIDTGIKHGTVAVLIDNEIVEITTYRIDGKYTDNRHPDEVEFTDLLREDLRRRDFTVNAMAYNPDTGIIDFFDGITDLNNKVLRAVGDPHKRFSEDALRILRAMRFSSKLDFEIETETKNAMLDLKHLLDKIAAERIRCELDGILQGKNAYDVLDNFAEIIKVFVPSYDGLKSSALYGNINIRRALFFTSAGDVKNTMSALRYSNADISAVALIDLYKDTPLKKDEIFIKRLLGKIGKENLLLLLAFQFPDGNNELENVIGKCSDECYRISDLAVSGNDLIELGFVGKEIKNKLEQLLEAVITNKVENTKNSLLNIIGGKK